MNTPRKSLNYPSDASHLYGLFTASLLSLTIIALTFVGLSQASSEPVDVVKLSAEVSHPLVSADQRNTVYLKVSLEGLSLPDQGERPPLNLALVIDRSGSMQGERIRRAKEAAILAVEMLGDDDIVSIIAYDTHAQVIVPATKARSKASILQAIRAIRPLNSTALHAGVTLGASETEKFLSKERVNRVVLLSDGIANVGPSSPSALAALGRELVARGLSVSTIGLGLGYNEDLMSQLASAADGNHVFVESPDQLASIMGMELGDALAAVIKDAELELTFAEGVRPVRALGREATFKGQQVSGRLGTIGAKQTRYLLIEAEVNPLKLDMVRELAQVKARFFVPSASKTLEQVAVAPAVKAVEGSATVRSAERKEVMEEVLSLLATEKQKIAVSMKDRGDSAGAARVMQESAQLLSSGAKRYRSKKLDSLSEEATEDSVEIKKSGADWSRLRKGMRRKAHKAKTQQAY